MEQNSNIVNGISAVTRTFDDYDLLCRECDAVLNGKAAKHDDAPDVCAMTIDFVTIGAKTKVTVMARPF